MNKEELVNELGRLNKALEKEDNPMIRLIIKDRIKEIEKMLEVNDND